jgi:hypothetical protein
MQRKLHIFGTLAIALTLSISACSNSPEAQAKKTKCDGLLNRIKNLETMITTATTFDPSLTVIQQNRVRANNEEGKKNFSEQKNQALTEFTAFCK